MASALDGIAVVSALATYKREVVPRVRDELRRWEDAARAIPDPNLREAALGALTEKAANVEATAVFAILAPRARRAEVLRAIAALQVAVDYLDTLSEQPVAGPPDGELTLRRALALHRALEEAVSPGAPHSDWYRLHPEREDGGYLAALVETCRRELPVLPAWTAVSSATQRAAARCGEGQSHTHAAARGAADRLRDWASRQQAPPGYSWWEVAAGASSSVAAHALIAAAADPWTGAEEAELVGAAYFPPVGALTVLLDDLIDREEDLAAGEHSYLAYYPDSSAAAERLAAIAAEAKTATARLRRGRRHTAILAGVVGFYLSAPAAKSQYARPIRDRMLKSLGTTVYPVIAAMRVLRRG